MKERYPNEINISAYYDTGAPAEDSIAPIVEKSVKESGRKIRHEEDYLELYFAAIKDQGQYSLDKEKVEKWIKNGAKPTDTVKALIEKA